MSPVRLHHRPVQVAPARRAAVVAGVVLGVLVLLALFPLVRGPAFVDHIVIDNRSSESINVAVRGDDATELSLAVVDAREQARVQAVLDQGDEWVFVFRQADETVGKVRVTRDQLASDGWRVVVPATEPVDGS